MKELIVESIDDDDVHPYNPDPYTPGTHSQSYKLSKFIILSLILLI